MSPETEFPIYMHCAVCRRATRHLLRHDELGYAVELECTCCQSVVTAENAR